MVNIFKLRKMLKRLKNDPEFREQFLKDNPVSDDEKEDFNKLINARL